MTPAPRFVDGLDIHHFTTKGARIAMTNEELATVIQNGDRERLTELWDQVRRLVWQQARRWAAGGRGGVEAEDLQQTGFIAVLRAADNFDIGNGAKFTTVLDYYLKNEFTAAVGLRTQRDCLDPLRSAVSLDAPLTDNTEDLFTLADTLPDPAAEAAIDDVSERDRAKRLHDALEAAIAELEPDQRAAIRRRYYEQAPTPPTGPEAARDRAAHNAAMKHLRHPSRSRMLLAAYR